MQYEIKIVPDSALPRDVPRVIVERDGSSKPLLIVTERVAGTWRFVKAWEALSAGGSSGVYLRAVS